MPEDINIIPTSAPKAAVAPQHYLFDAFCELLKCTLFALEEDAWAEDAGWEIAFGQSLSEAEVAWRLVSVQADDVLATYPLSTNDLVLHRTTRLLKRAVTASDLAALQHAHAKLTEIRFKATSAVAPAVKDLVQEAEICIAEMYDHACESEDNRDSILPLAA